MTEHEAFDRARADYDALTADLAEEMDLDAGWADALRRLHEEETP